MIQCESAEAAELVLEHVGGCLAMLLTDINLAGTMDGIELAQIAHKIPALRIVVISPIRASAVCPPARNSSQRRGACCSYCAKRIGGSISGASL